MTKTVVFDAVAVEQLLARLWALDELLVERGFHATSAWWRAEADRFLRSLAVPRRVRRWVVRVGRRGGKSSFMCRLAIVWWKYGPWLIPAGDIATFAWISVNRDEASSRLRTLATILDALGERYEQRDGEIEVFGDRPALFRVHACTVKAVVGFTSPMCVGDEVSRWESRDSAANPASEVFASMRPSMASLPMAIEVMVSAPFGSDDAHAAAFDEGDTEAQIVSFAPTWIANPTITEERTHELEPDPRIWAREYAAEPGATVTNAIDVADVAAIFGRTMPTDVARWYLPIDASSLRGDIFAWLLAGITHTGAVVVTEVGGFDGDELRNLSMRDVVRDIAARARPHKAHVLGDQREEASLSSMFGEERVPFKSYAWSEPSKDGAMQLLRRLMRERRVYACDHAQLRSQLTTLKARLLPSGRIRYETSGVDYASALITLAHAIEAGDVPLKAAAPFRIHVPRDTFTSRWSGYGSGRGFG